MHAIHPDGCTTWPQPSFSPCAYDWLGILWHNIGWYSSDRRTEFLTPEYRISERNDPPYGAPGEMIEVFRREDSRPIVHNPLSAQSKEKNRYRKNKLPFE